VFSYGVVLDSGKYNFPWQTSFYQGVILHWGCHILSYIWSTAFSWSYMCNLAHAVTATFQDHIHRHMNMEENKYQKNTHIYFEESGPYTYIYVTPQMPLWKLNWVICFFVHKKNFIPENHNYVQKEMLLSSHSHTSSILSSEKILIAFTKQESGKTPQLLYMNCHDTLMPYYGLTLTIFHIVWLKLSEDVKPNGWKL